MRNFIYVFIIILAAQQSISMEVSQEKIKSYVELFKQRGDIYNRSSDLYINKTFVDNLYKALADTIQKNELPENMRVKFKLVNQKNMSLLVRAFKNNTKIQDLSFEDCDIDTQVTSDIIDLINNNTNLQEFSLICPFITKRNIKRLEHAAYKLKLDFKIIAPKLQLDLIGSSKL